jgi:hypothetical protein
MGFCEAVLSLAGGTEIRAVFQECAWKKDRRTLLSLEWNEPSAK